MSRSFIPDDKPKSWVVFTLAGLIGVVIFGPLMFAGDYFGSKVLYNLAFGGFLICWMAACGAGILLTVGKAQGKYANVEKLPWDKQVW